MYEARASISKIIKMLVKREKVKESEEREKMNQRIVSEIKGLQNEHRNFKRPFIYKKQEVICSL